MAFYDLSKEERVALVNKIQTDIGKRIATGKEKACLKYFSDEDTYIRKTAYLAIGKIYLANENLRQPTIQLLNELMKQNSFHVRQTVVNAAGEIGKKDFEVVQHFFDGGLFDAHHTVRNAVIGSVKKMSEINPTPVLSWAKKYLHHSDKEIRREICHGIELRGRKYPEDILPLLKELQFDETARVRNTLVHVLGQIAYKKGCLETVLTVLKQWQNQELVADALEEIIDVHDRYKDFSFYTTEAAVEIVSNYFPKNKF